MRHRFPRLVAAFVRLVCRLTLRAVVAGLIFTTCLLAALAYVGAPLPDLYELLEGFEGVSRLAEILS